MLWMVSCSHQTAMPVGGRQSNGLKCLGCSSEPQCSLLSCSFYAEQRTALTIQYFIFSSSYLLLTHLTWWENTVHSLEILGKPRGVLTQEAVSSQTKALHVELDGTLQIVHLTEKQTRDPGREHHGWILECLCSSTSRARGRTVLSFGN